MNVFDRRRPFGRVPRRTRIIVAVCGALAVIATAGVISQARGGGSTDLRGNAVPAAGAAGGADGASPSDTAGPESDGQLLGSANPSPATSPTSGTPGAAAGSGPGRRTPKKGVSTYDFSGNDGALVDVKASWYYNWSPAKTKTARDPGIEFVPMIWGPNNVNAATLDRAKSQGSVLLGFNEPDFAEQSNLSPQAALDLWPKLVATGMRLGSPAPAINGAKPGGWLDQFMSGAAARGYRVDFIALHWYGGDFSPAAVGHLRNYLQATWDRYHKNIWLTEFALMRFEGGTAIVPTQEQQVAFVRGATAMLEGLSFVERYSWFSLPATKVNSTGLYRDGTTPTQVGAAYRAAG